MYYNNFLRHELPRLLDEAGVPANVRLHMYYMHDGAPCHSSDAITQHLNGVFGNRWLANTGPWRWPARSPDLTPMDFFLWGFVKNYVYRTRNILSREETMVRVNEAFQLMRDNPRMVQEATADVIRRANFVIRANGQHIEQYPRNFDFDRQWDNVV